MAIHYSKEIRRLIGIAAKRYGVGPHVIAGLIEQESGGNPNAVSSAGAFGLTQFLPSTAKGYGVKRGSSHTAKASQILGAAHYLHDLGYRKNRQQALGRYYGSTSASYKGEVLNKASAYYKKGLFGGGEKGYSRSRGGTRTELTGKLKTIPGVSHEADRRQAKLDLLSSTGSKMPSQGQLLNLAGTLRDLRDEPAQQSFDLSRKTVRDKGGGGRPGRDGIPRGKSARGTANFEGTKVAAWIKPYLVYARKHGWKGKVTSGYRSRAEQTQIYNSGVRPAARPGTSNHEGTDFPRGAIDVTDAAQLNRILRRRGTKKLRYAGSKDPVHFSHPHGGSY